MSEDIEDLTEAICAGRLKRLCAVATFFARPEWPEIRGLVDQIAPDCVEAIEAVVERVRRSVWRDMS